MKPARRKFSFAEIRVGLFVLVCVVILTLAIIYISSGAAIFGPTFQAVTYLPTVGGLKAGAPILLAGVEVGSVESITILPRDREPRNLQNLEIYRRIEASQREIDARRERVPEYGEQLKKMVSERDRLVQAKRQSSQDFRHLQEAIAEQQVVIDNNLNRLSDLQSGIQSLRLSIQNVEVVMRIDQRYRAWIRSDSEVGVGSIGLLGDKFVDITLGRSEADSAVNERQQVVITGRKEADFRELITGIDDAIGNFGVLAQRFRNITDKLEQGSVAQFLGDRSFYDNLNTTLRDATETMNATTSLVRDMKEGKGTLGRLIAEDKLYQELHGAVSHSRDLLQGINNGQGTLGKLTKDDQIYNQTRSIMSSADDIAARIRRGEGTLGKLVQDEALYERTRLALDRFAGLVEDLEQGRGTAGKLFKDQQLYDNMTQVSAEMVKLLYDFRQDPKKYLTIRFRLF